jgi:hypothetical protein
MHYGRASVPIFPDQSLVSDSVLLGVAVVHGDSLIGLVLFLARRENIFSRLKQFLLSQIYGFN